MPEASHFNSLSILLTVVFFFHQTSCFRKTTPSNAGRHKTTAFLRCLIHEGCGGEGGHTMSHGLGRRMGLCCCGAGLVPVVSVGSAKVQLGCVSARNKDQRTESFTLLNKSEPPQLCNCARDLWHKRTLPRTKEEKSKPRGRASLMAQW